MNTEKKVLTPEPIVGEHCKMINSQLGEYTELGIFNFLENVYLDDFSYTGQFCFLQNTYVGKFANIAAMVRIGPTHHPIERPTLHHFTYRREMFGMDSSDDTEFFQKRESSKTFIGHDTWIGHGAIIMPGVKVGNGAVVGSGAVVTKDVEPYTVVAGVPAKLIKRRFSPEIAAKLEAIQWWDWSFDQIKANFNDFLLDIETFIHKHDREG